MKKKHQQVIDPCIQICTIDPDSELCMGCSRTSEEINNWLDANMNNQGEWIKNVYWSLEVYSCVLIKRQKEWFNYAIPILQNIWHTICVERMGDYSMRAPKKRNNK